MDKPSDRAMVNQESLNSLKPITEKIIGCAFKVRNCLGAGFLEKVYENVLSHELCNAGMHVQQQFPTPVYYDGVRVGEFFADILVEDTVLVELKAVKSLDESHWAQCLNYLKASGLRLCLLINFGSSSVEIKRIAL